MRPSAAFGQQQIAPIFDRKLSGLRKPLQKPGQRHFQSHMIVSDVEMAGRRLTEGADAEDHAVSVPPFLIDFQNGDAQGSPRQTRLEAPTRLVAAKPVWNRNDERCGHCEYL